MYQRKLFYLGYAIAAITLSALLFLSQATEGSQQFEQYYQPLVLSIILGVIGLIIIDIFYLYAIYKNYRNNVPGTSLSLTILWRTLFLAFIPLFFISFFSFKFLRYEFQSSFDVGINEALNNALVLSKKALAVQGEKALDESKQMAQIIANYDYINLQTRLEPLRQRYGAFELAVFDEQGFVQSYASQDLTTLFPYIPEHSDFIRVERESGIFVFLSDKNNYQIRTLVDVNVIDNVNYYLQSVFVIPDTVSALTAQVNETITERDKLNYLMPRVNRSFIFVLILVVCLSALLLILSSVNFASEVSQPIRSLIQGTKRVSQGNFSEGLIIDRQDDFGTLMQSFNRMTYSLRQATEDANHNRERVESERAYLATVINHMKAGVVTLDNDYRLLTYNQRAEQLLDATLAPAILLDIDLLNTALNSYKMLIYQVIEKNKSNKNSEEIELQISTKTQSKVLMASLTALSSNDTTQGGYVLIFDAMSDYLQQQKQAAWEEVARRLAHEIKNPLTPIQLAAERLNYKLSGFLEPSEQQLLSRSVEVITKQVKSLKDMVNDFSDFAKPHSTDKTPIAFAEVLRDVLDLYRGHQSVDIELHLDQRDDVIMGNAEKIRQVLHNLIKNAIEACDLRHQDDKAQQRGSIILQLQNAGQTLTFVITDNGVGLSDDDNHFEPYVTTKAKGTGLGLAIVKKILQDHQGQIDLQARTDQTGCVVTLTLPLHLHQPFQQAHDEPATI